MSEDNDKDSKLNDWQDDKGRFKSGVSGNAKGGTKGLGSRAARTMSDASNRLELGKAVRLANKHIQKVLSGKDEVRKDKMVATVLAEFGKAEERDMKRKKLKSDLAKARQEQEAAANNNGNDKEELGSKSHTSPIVSFVTGRDNK